MTLFKKAMVSTVSMAMMTAAAVVSPSGLPMMGRGDGKEATARSARTPRRMARDQGALRPLGAAARKTAEATFNALGAGGYRVYS